MRGRVLAACVRAAASALHAGAPGNICLPDSAAQLSFITFDPMNYLYVPNSSYRRLITMMPLTNPTEKKVE